MRCLDTFPTQKRRRQPSVGLDFSHLTRKENKTESINILQMVELGGVKQAIHIRGESLNLPMLVFFHGGPGLPHMPFAHVNAELTKWFLVVQWDQRGAGKSYSPRLHKSDVSIEQLVSDAHELLFWLHQSFGPKKLVLVGHSWGSVLGALVACRYPNLVSAFVGVGQVSCLQKAEVMRYRLCLELAAMHHDASTQAVLRELGAPPYHDVHRSDRLEELASNLARFFYHPVEPADLDRLANSSPVYTKEDVLRIPLGRCFSEQCLWEQIFSGIDLFRQVPRLDIPTCLIVGRHDMVSMHQLAIDYFDFLHAPQGKSFITMHASGHWPHHEQARLFRSVLVETLRNLNILDQN